MEPVCPLNQKCTHGVIRSRRAIKLAFALANRDKFLIQDYEMTKAKRKFGFTLQLTPVADELVIELKKLIPYSCSTIHWDIFHSTLRLLIKHLKKQNHEKRLRTRININ